MAKKLTQTQLGEHFGISSIIIGKKLVELNLRDKDTKLATDYAIKNNLAKNVTYLNDQKTITMSIWNKETIEYINQKTLNDDDFLADMLFGRLQTIKKLEDSYNGDKIQCYAEDISHTEFKNLFKKLSNNHNILSIFYKKIKKNKLDEYIKKFNFLKNIEEITARYVLDKNLIVNKKIDKVTKI